MKRCIAIVFLSVFLITYFIPITSVHATEVIWGENNTYVLNDIEFANCRNLAVLDMIPQLTSTGITELSIDNTQSIDDFIINFLDYIDENAQSTVSDVYSVCNDIKNAIDEKANEIGYFLKGVGYEIPNQLETLTGWLSYTDSLPKFDVKLNPNFTHDFNRLSRIDHDLPDIDNNYLDYINRMNLREHVNRYFSFYDALQSNSVWSLQSYPATNYSWIAYLNSFPNNTNFTSTGYMFASNILDLHIYSLNGTYYLDITINYISNTFKENNTISGCGYFWLSNGNFIPVPNSNVSIASQSIHFSGTLEQVLEHCAQNFKNVNVYVDDVLWARANDNQNNSILINIDGINFYNDTDNEPVRYYYPQGTKIDYKKLYLVIKEAIDDLQPISQTTINEGDVYYDSHDNVYSPTIYNYYNDDNDVDEEDILSDIIDIANIPKFDTALLAPIEEPLTNGTVIMINSVQALPEDILFVLGAAFVLILFVAMINRLIE